MSKVGSWIASHKQEAALGIGGIVVTIALYEKSRKAAAANGTSTSSAVSPTYSAAIDPSTGIPYSQEIPATADTTASDTYNGLESQILGLQQAFLGTTTTPGASTTTTPTPTKAGPTPAAAGFGDQTFGGSVYDEIGIVTNGLFTGDNVSGGAPVYYDVGGKLETNLSQQAISGLPVGTDVFTTQDAQDLGLVGTQKVTGQKI